MSNLTTLQTIDKRIAMRPLISYALSSTCMSSDKGNYFSALIPLFVPIVEKNKGNFFDPKTFCDEVKMMYGLPMHPYVAESFTSSMVDAGLLKKTDATKGAALYTYFHENCGRDKTKDYDEFDAKLAEVFTLYEQFIKNLGSLTTLAYTNDELEDSLISWLVSSKGELSIADGFSDEPKGDLQYTAARFIQDIEKSRPDLFASLAAISSGAVVSELVLDYKCPVSSGKKARDLSVYLDAPFVMNLLDLSGKHNKISAQLIFDQLKKLECNLYVFKHSCEELEASIGAVLAEDNNDKHGYLAEALRNREVIEDYARAVQRNPERYIQGLGIKIMDMDALGNQRLQYFNDDLMDKFRASLVNWKNSIAKERDARSLAYVMRLRGGGADRDFLKSKCLFVTNNYTLAGVARNFCIAEGLVKQSLAAPIITVRTLSAILFLTLGSTEEKSEVSRKQLVSNCGKAVIATPSMMKSFYEKLKTFSPENEAQIAAIINEPRSLQCIMDQTWGNPEVVSSQNYEKILEIAKAEIAHEQSEKHKVAMSAISVQMDVLSNDNAKLQNSIIKAVRDNVNRSIKTVNVIALMLKLTISLGMLILTVDAVLKGNVGIAFPYGLFFSASLIFLKDLTDVWPEYLERYVDHIKLKMKMNLFVLFWRVLGFEYNLDTLSIDWKKGDVSERPKDLL